MKRTSHSARRIISEDLRAHNRGLILEEAFRRGNISRGALAQSTGLTGAAISRITRELIQAGLLREQSGTSGPGGPGRPTRELEFLPGGAFVVGVGIGAYEQWVQIADMRGRSIARRALRLRSLRTAESALRNVVQEIKALAAAAAIPQRRIIGCGIAIAGLVDPASGTVLQSPNLGWRDVPVADRLGAALGAPVCVDAMHHALNLAEMRRTSAQDESVVLINAAMGIGASVMLHGSVLRGGHAAAGQIGHMRVAGANDLCTCGRRGCLDTVASGYAVLRRLKAVANRKAPKEHDVKDARRLMQIIGGDDRGAPSVLKALFESGQQLGAALGIVARVLDPDRFVLAGPLAQTESYVAGVRSGLGASSPALSVSVLPADSAGAWLALSRFVLSSTLDLSRLRS